MVDQAKCFMAFFFVLLGPLEGRNILLGPLDATNMMGILFTILTLTLNRLQISRAMIISSPTAIFRKITRLFSIILDDRVIVICQYIRIRRGNCSDLDKLPDRLTVVLPCLVYVVHVGHIRRDLFAFFLVCFVHVGRTRLCFGRDIRVLRVACVTCFQVVVLCIACVTCLCGGYLLIGQN